MLRCSRPVKAHRCFAPRSVRSNSADAIAAGAAGVGVGSAVNRLNDELAMVAVVRGLREALGSAVVSRV